MSKRVNNKKGNRLRKGVARMPVNDQPCKVRAASSYGFSVLGAQSKFEALLRRQEQSRADQIYKSWVENKSFLRRMA